MLSNTCIVGGQRDSRTEEVRRHKLNGTGFGRARPPVTNDVRMRPSGWFTLCLLFFAVLAGPAFCSASKSWNPSDLPNPQHDLRHVCGRHGGKSAVCSPDGLLSPSDADALDGLINFIADGTHGFDKSQCGSHLAGYQVAVAIVYKMDIGMFSDAADTASKFARALHDSWGVGDAACQNGVVIFVSVSDRAMHISTGRGAKQVLTDKRVHDIFQRIKPLMRKEQYGKALLAAVNQVGLVVSGRATFSGQSEGSDAPWMILFFPLFMCFCCWNISSSRRRRRDFSKCKAALQRIDRDTKRANENRFEAKSCPICLEDFAIGDDADKNSSNAASKPSATEEENVSEDRAGLLDDGTQDANRVITLRCGHMFHANCIASWAAGGEANRRLCPVCRKPVEDDAEEETVLRSDVAGFEDERQFRIRRAHDIYPDFVTYEMINRWRYDRNTELATNTEFVNLDPAVVDAARSAGQGGSSFSFGGGSSFGGGGGGDSW